MTFTHQTKRWWVAGLVLVGMNGACSEGPPTGSVDSAPGVDAVAGVDADRNLPDSAPPGPDADLTPDARAARSVRLVAIGDQGSGNDGQSCVAAAMNTKCADGCDAVLLLGDNFYDNGVGSVDDVQWVEKFENIYDLPHLNGLPFYAILGNHDYGLTSTGNKQAQIDYASLPVGTGPGTRLSDKWHMPAAWYTQSLGDGLVDVFAIDTQDYLNSTQSSEIQTAENSSTATWKLVIGHHPRFTSGNHQLDNGIIGALGMFAFQSGIYCSADLFLTGHDHDREFIDKGEDIFCPNTYFAISGAGSKLRDSLFPAVGHQLFYDQTTVGFAYLVYGETELTFEFWAAVTGSCEAPELSYSLTIPR